ncbi:MAG: hypothetical protein ACLP22_05230 [Solirubrobacteraceae bacterium]
MGVAEVLRDAKQRSQVPGGLALVAGQLAKPQLGDAIEYLGLLAL